MSADSVSPLALRRAIREYVETHDDPRWTTTVNEVAAERDVSATAVGEQLSNLHAEGFVYAVAAPDGDGKVLRLP